MEGFSVHFVLRIAAKSTLGALLIPLFEQFLYDIRKQKHRTPILVKTGHVIGTYRSDQKALRPIHLKVVEIRTRRLADK